MQPSVLKKFKQEYSIARLYKNQNIMHGEMEVIEDDGKEVIFLYVVKDVIIDLFDKTKFVPWEGFSSVEDSVGIIVPEKRHFQLAYFSVGYTTLAKL